MSATHADPTRHRCLIYEGDPSVQLAVTVPLLREGLETRWRCLYLASPEMVAMTSAALRAGGIDVEREQGRGALLLSSDRSHLNEDVFHPRKMIDALCSSIDRAVRDGFQGLCATGDMRWELGADQNFDRLLEYEAELEKLFREKPLRGICQYHRNTVPGRAVRDALLTHQGAYIGGALTEDNVFYVPPELLSTSAGSEKHGDWMCQQLVRVLDAEKARDEALAALKRSEAQQRRLADQLHELNRTLEKRVADRSRALEIARENLEAFVRMSRSHPS